MYFEKSWQVKISHYNPCPQLLRRCIPRLQFLPHHMAPVPTRSGAWQLFNNRMGMCAGFPGTSLFMFVFLGTLSQQSFSFSKVSPIITYLWVNNLWKMELWILFILFDLSAFSKFHTINIHICIIGKNVNYFFFRIKNKNWLLFKSVSIIQYI